MSTPGEPTAPVPQLGHRREIVRLAVPAFLALVAEPLFLLADSAIVGHLGTAPLAGLGVASAVLLTAANLLIFLAYGTTAVVARRLGAGDAPGAVGAGMDGIWLAVLLGGLAAALVALLAEPMAGAFGATEAAVGQAVTYLRVSALGLPGMVVVLAATGVLRGLQDTRTPLVVSVLGFTTNGVLSFLLVHPAGMGIAGAAWGTVIAQTAMGLTLVAVVVRGARRLGAPMSFRPARVLRAARDGVPLLVRTLALRAVLLLTTAAAARTGEPQLAAYQVSMTVWSALTFALDALAIAGQALTGRYLGADDVAGARRATATMVRWGVGFGGVLTLALLAVHPVLPLAFSRDPEVIAALTAALVVVALSQPVSGVAFVLDGVLIGAGDARWLAWAQTAFLVAYLPMVGAVVASGVRGTDGLVWLWVAFTGWMGVRTAGLVWRARGTAWAVTGATR